MLALSSSSSSSSASFPDDEKLASRRQSGSVRQSSVCLSRVGHGHASSCLDLLFQSGDTPDQKSGFDQRGVIGDSVEIESRRLAFLVETFFSVTSAVFG